MTIFHFFPSSSITVGSFEWVPCCQGDFLILCSFFSSLITALLTANELALNSFNFPFLYVRTANVHCDRCPSSDQNWWMRWNLTKRPDQICWSFQNDRKTVLLTSRWCMGMHTAKCISHLSHTLCIPLWVIVRVAHPATWCTPCYGDHSAPCSVIRCFSLINHWIQPIAYCVLSISATVPVSRRPLQFAPICEHVQWNSYDRSLARNPWVSIC